MGGIQKKIELNVHIHTDMSSASATVPLQDLYLLLTCNWRFDGPQTGIPCEMVTKIYDDYGDLRVAPGQQHDPLQFCCVAPTAGDELEYVLQVISIFNQTRKFSLSVLSRNVGAHILQECANDNTSMLPARISSINCDVIITYGPGALHFIRQQTPVIILGPYGFGGLVTSANFPWFLENGFMGRPGGTHGEPVPASVVLDELMACKENKELLTPSGELTALARALPNRPLSDSRYYTQQACTLHAQLLDPGRRGDLTPVVASNIELIPQGGNIYIRRSKVHTTLAVLQKKDHVFFQQMDGRRTCAELMVMTSLDQDAFWTYLYALWEKKIILFDAVQIP